MIQKLDYPLVGMYPFSGGERHGQHNVPRRFGRRQEQIRIRKKQWRKPRSGRISSKSGRRTQEPGRVQVFVGRIPFEHKRKQPLVGWIPFEHKRKRPLVGRVSFERKRKQPFVRRVPFERKRKKPFVGRISFERKRKQPLVGRIPFGHGDKQARRWSSIFALFGYIRQRKWQFRRLSQHAEEQKEKAVSCSYSAAVLFYACRSCDRSGSAGGRR